MILTQIDETALIDLINLSHLLLVPCKIIDKNIVIITLSKFGQSLVQLIIVPKNTTVNDHKHPEVVTTIKPIYGKAEIRKSDRSILIDGYNCGKDYIISCNESHGLRTFHEPFVFIAAQEWLEGNQPTSIEENLTGKL